MGDILLRFRAVIIAAICYLVLGLVFHWRSLDEQWGDESKYIWTDSMVAIFTFQRLGESGLFSHFLKIRFLHRDKVIKI